MTEEELMEEGYKALAEEHKKIAELTFEQQAEYYKVFPSYDPQILPSKEQWEEALKTIELEEI